MDKFIELLFNGVSGLFGAGLFGAGFSARGAFGAGFFGAGSYGAFFLSPKQTNFICTWET